MTQFCLTYPVDLTAIEDGRILARIPDLIGCVTDGADREEALVEAADALGAALAGAMAQREDIPAPSPAIGRPVVAPNAVIAGKVALYSAMRGSKMSNVALASKLGCTESEVRRLLDPTHNSKIGALEQALIAVGRRMVITFEAA